MYKIKTQEFEGPLSLLLQLIEQEKLDITKISLSNIADQYLARIDELGESLPTAELADFLVVAGRLLVIKSQVLLPSLNSAEEDVDDLERQLKMYKAYRDAASVIEKIIAQKRFAYSRQEFKIIAVPKFAPPKNIFPNTLARILKSLIAELEKTTTKLTKKSLAKMLSIKDRINYFREIFSKVSQMGFKDFLKTPKNKAEVVVSFLALLELVKQRYLAAEQEDGDIIIKSASNH